LRVEAWPGAPSEGRWSSGGLISKHGILIVQFTNGLQALGRSMGEAIEEAAAIRLLCNAGLICGRRHIKGQYHPR
jgi:hypothetical protein